MLEQLEIGPASELRVIGVHGAYVLEQPATGVLRAAGELLTAAPVDLELHDRVFPRGKGPNRALPLALGEHSGAVGIYSAGEEPSVASLDLFAQFDDALDWQLDDPLLADHVPADLGDEPWPLSGRVLREE